MIHKDFHQGPYAGLLKSLEFNILTFEGMEGLREAYFLLHATITITTTTTNQGQSQKWLITYLKLNYILLKLRGYCTPGPHF